MIPLGMSKLISHRSVQKQGNGGKISRDVATMHMTLRTKAFLNLSSTLCQLLDRYMVTDEASQYLHIFHGDNLAGPFIPPDVLWSTMSNAVITSITSSHSVAYSPLDSQPECDSIRLVG